MKKIINNKLYDTESAKLAASWSSPGSVTDFSYYEESLYRKKTGEYFLHGCGGPSTKYAKSAGQNQWTNGEAIIPLTYENARKWAEEKLDGDEYEEIFGKVEEEDDKTINATFRLKLSMLETLRQRSSEDGVSLSVFVERILEKELAED